MSRDFASNLLPIYREMLGFSMTKLNGQTSIYDIVKKEKLDVVNKPIS